MSLSIDINLNLPQTPQGVPQDLFSEFNRLYNAIRNLAGFLSAIDSTVNGFIAHRGSAVLVAGVAVVANSAVLAGSLIFLTTQILGTVATPKAVAITARTPGVSFTITSSDNTDTSQVAWWFI